MEDRSRYETARRKYCSNFALQYKKFFAPHYLYGTLRKRGKGWRNVGEHCLVAGVFADILCELLGIIGDARKTVVAAAIIHDWYKKVEIQVQESHRQAGIFSMETLDLIKNNETQLLKNMGIDPKVAKLAGANLPSSGFGPVGLEEKIVWYVDAMLSNTEPMSIRKRFSDLLRGWDGAKEDPKRAERNRAFSELFRFRFNGKSLYDLQVELGTSIGRLFSERIGFMGETERFPYFLECEFIKRTAKF